jgi:hypothetical protein
MVVVGTISLRCSVVVVVVSEVKQSSMLDVPLHDSSSADGVLNLANTDSKSGSVVVEKCEYCTRCKIVGALFSRFETLHIRKLPRSRHFHAQVSYYKLRNN